MWWIYPEKTYPWKMFYSPLVLRRSHSWGETLNKSERERKREGGRESERQSRSTEHLSGKRKKICFCTLSEYPLSWVFAGPLVLLDSSYRNKALSRKEPQFSDISSSLIVGQEKSGFAHTHLFTESENDKMSYRIGHSIISMPCQQLSKASLSFCLFWEVKHLIS